MKADYIRETDGPVLVIGDTHGNDKLIMYRIRSRKFKRAVIFHVGDFGVGFLSSPEMELLKLEKLNNFLVERECELFVIRGNHDDPSYFNGDIELNYSNLHLVPDYTVVKMNGKNILMVGGAISIDRMPRIDGNARSAEYGLTRRTYWEDERFTLDEEKLVDMTDIVYVITHSSPAFTKPYNSTANIFMSHGPMVERYAESDDKLKDDLNKERSDITKMYEILKQSNNIKKWYYGHFHDSYAEYHDETDFILLNIDEIKEIDYFY